MNDILCLLLALNQSTSQPFSTAQNVAEPDRLALTPKIDGRLEAEEWDALTAGDGNDTFFQWQPGKLHAAAKLPVGQAMIVSFDLKSNGWLVGKDNLEVRVRWNGDRPDARVRILDATPASGPVWVEAPMYQEAISCSATVEGNFWIAEVTLADPGLRSLPEKSGDKIAVRIDGVTAGESEFEPFIPRVTTPLKLTLDRGSNVPGGLNWRPQVVSRSVAPGSSIRIRMTFNGANELGLRRAEMRTEGLAKDDTTLTALPFPSFDNKGRAFVDYNTPVAPQAQDGYRILRTTLTDGQGQTAVLRTSYEIAPPVVFDLAAPGKLKVSDKEQRVKCSAYARNNTTRRVDGTLRVAAPTGWEVTSGDDKGFTIYNSYGSVRRVFELLIPAGTKGTFPIKLQADMGGKGYTQTEWITIG